MARLTVIRGGRLIDPDQGLDLIADLWLEGTRVVGLEPPPGAVPDKIINATGLLCNSSGNAYITPTNIPDGDWAVLVQTNP